MIKFNKESTIKSFKAMYNYEGSKTTRHTKYLFSAVYFFVMSLCLSGLVGKKTFYSRLNKQIIILFIISVLFYSCSGNSVSDEKDKIPVTDMLGREVLIPAKIDKIICIRAGTLRLLTYMDALDLIVGIEEGEKRTPRPYIKINPYLLDLQSVGPTMGGDAELIISTRPDIIFTAYTTIEDADNLQNKTGIPVIALECTDIGTDKEILFASLQLIGNVLNKKNRADSLINYINSSINELNERTAKIPDNLKPTVYAGGLAYSHSYGITATHPYYSPFMFVNANNVASSIDRRLSSHVKGTFVDIEQILIWNPNYLFIDESGISIVKTELETNQVLNSKLDAVKNDNIYVILPYNNYATNYEFVILNAWYIGKVLYPDYFEDIDFELKANEILSMFFNRNIVLDEIINNKLIFTRFLITNL